MSELISTRDPERCPIAYSDALLEGLAPDKGLYVPTTYPVVPMETLGDMQDKPYSYIFSCVKKLFAADIPPKVIEDLGERSFSAHNFPTSYEKDGNIVPVENISSNIFIQNLSLGPTAAFKDMALLPLAQEMDHVLGTRGQTLDLLGATSGDTGSSAEAAIKSLASLRLFMLSPQQGMSDFQRAQMGALSGNNIFNLSIDGRFDDCQDLVKAVKQDPKFKNLGAVNSINWGRISSQVAYYVSGYLQVSKAIGEPVDFVVPTGNFGNILAGYIARKIGVPIRSLAVATNENNVLHTLTQTGVYTRKSARVTSSPSMDISKASNYERLVFDLFEGDANKVASYMDEFEKTGSVDFKNHGLDSDTMSALGFKSGVSTHQDRLEAMRWAYRESGKVIDPHTADAVSVARTLKDNDDIPVICLSTALPVKFEDTVQEALGFIPRRENRFEDLVEDGEGFINLDNDLAAVKGFISRNS